RGWTGSQRYKAIRWWYAAYEVSGKRCSLHPMYAMPRREAGVLYWQLISPRGGDWTRCIRSDIAPRVLPVRRVVAQWMSGNGGAWNGNTKTSQFDSLTCCVIAACAASCGAKLL